MSSSRPQKPEPSTLHSKPSVLGRLSGTLVGRGWRWLRSQERDAWFHAPLVEQQAPTHSTTKPNAGAPRKPRNSTVVKALAQPPLFDDWQLPLTAALKKQIRQDVSRQLPPEAQPSAAQWKMIFSSTPTTCVVAGAGAGKSTSLVLRLLVVHHYLGFELDSLSVVTFTRESRRDFIKKVCQVFDIWSVAYEFSAVRDVVRTYHSLILPMIHALPAQASTQAFENVGMHASEVQQTHTFNLRLNDSQRQLLNQCYRQLMSDPEFAAQIGRLRLRAAVLPRLEAGNPQVQKRAKAMALASSRDGELCDLIEQQWEAAGAWPIKGIKKDRQAIDIQGYKFYSHGYIAKLGAWVVLGCEAREGGEVTRSGAKIPVWGEWAVKRTLFQAFCDKPLIWLDNYSDSKRVVASLTSRSVSGPGFDYQVAGELAAAPLLDAFVAAASFIENLGLQVPAALDALTFAETDPDVDFFNALKAFWPAFEAHLQQQTPPLLTFNRMFAMLGEDSAEQLRQLPDEVLRPMSHLMVDEFQDISPQIVGWLRASLAEIQRRGAALSGERHAGHSSLLCVGDDWQSIYGWRGSAPRYFVEFRQTFPAHACTRVMLTDNYRSHQHIIDAAEHVVASVRSLPGKAAKACGQQAEPAVAVKVLSRDPADLARRASEHYHNGDSILLLYRKSADRQLLAEHLQGLLLADQALPAEQRGIKQLTYHSAKGLQADAVFMFGDCQHSTVSPYKNQIYRLAGLSGPDEEQGYDRAQHEEALRLAYVGITRAIRHCYWYVETASKPGAKASDHIRAGLPFFTDLRLPAPPR